MRNPDKYTAALRFETADEAYQDWMTIAPAYRTEQALLDRLARVTDGSVTVIKFPERTYTAKLFEVEDLKVAGTLDGYLDLAFPDRTYQISPTKALALAAALRGAVEDIRANCLYDNDVLLEQC